MSQKENRRIALTGATRGLGRALTGHFAEAGHTVLGCGRSPEIVAELASRYPAPHHFATLDVTDDTAVASWVEEISAGGVPDLLINNAALINKPAPLWQIPAEEFDPVIDVNIKGVANTIRHMVPRMIEAGRGIIVNLSSGWGRSTSPEVAPYCATKYAIEGLSAALSQELPEGLAAIALNPGIIATDMLRDAFGDGAGAYPTPEEWVQSAGPFILKLSSRDNGGSLTVT